VRNFAANQLQLAVDQAAQLQRVDVLRDVVPALLVERAQDFRHDFRGCHPGTCGHAQQVGKPERTVKRRSYRRVIRIEGGLKLRECARVGRCEGQAPWRCRHFQPQIVLRYNAADAQSINRRNGASKAALRELALEMIVEAIGVERIERERTALFESHVFDKGVAAGATAEPRADHADNFRPGAPQTHRMTDRLRQCCITIDVCEVAQR
jgi:hypothetical protein